MLKTIYLPLILICFSLFGNLNAEVLLNELQNEQVINGFIVKSIYTDNNDKPMGGRFVSEKYGFIIDLVQIQSIPQSFIWVKTSPTSSKGEPHACEHLVLMKGNVGRKNAAMEQMYLTTSTAYTEQLRTCYHFNTNAGTDNFYKVFEGKLNALLHPDFTDEEILREICHLSVDVNPEDGSLSIDEKGAVYTEMVSSFEKPWYHTYGTLNIILYGENHPLTYSSGGNPDVMRSMTAQDMWDFHKTNYRLANMGTIISISPDIPLDSFLYEMNEILNRLQNSDEPLDNPMIKVENLPAPESAEIGSVRISSFPAKTVNTPGYMFFAWPPQLKLNPKEQFLLDQFLSTFANGQTSNLYNLLINSETKKIDIGGTYVYGGYDNDCEVSISIAIGNVKSDVINEEMLNIVFESIKKELVDITKLDPQSNELKKFNDRLLNNLKQQKEYYKNVLNSPPNFGQRGGPAGRWVSLLMRAEQLDGFEKSLTLKDYFEYVENRLKEPGNIWAGLIDSWKMLDTPPYLLGAIPDINILAKKAEEKEQRLAHHIENLKNEYKVEDTQLALAKFKEAFDAKTAELEVLRVNAETPSFVDNPPMTFDDQIDYQIIPITDKVDMVASTFENLSSATFGLALNMKAVPESLLVYLTLLPNLLTDIGVVKDGEVYPYEKMEEQQRNDLYYLYSTYTVNPATGRIELILEGRGANPDQLRNVLDWMEASLYHPYLSLDNLNRIQDVIKQTLSDYGNTTRRSEETWVNDPANAFRFQNNPLYLSTNSFLTGEHNIFQLKWLLTDPGNETEQTEITSFIDNLLKNGNGKTKIELTELLDSESSLTAMSSDYSRKLSSDIISDLKSTINNIPDENVAEDWGYLCDLIRDNLLTKPQDVLAEIKETIKYIQKADLARLYMTSNSTDRKNVLDDIKAFTEKLDHNSTAFIQSYNSNNLITEKLKSRYPDLEKPVYTGLLTNETNNGTIIFTSKITDIYDDSDDGVLNAMSGKLYSFYGPHTLFTKTLEHGLAYSNGYRFVDSAGFARYYAERCPDVAETMKFVADYMNNFEKNPTTAEYAIAQMFRESRASQSYEERGYAIAADIADGNDPDKIKKYRQKVIDLKNRENLIDELNNRLKITYGSVLTGFGKPLSESNDGIFFLIGPESQFQSLEKYIESTEGKQTVYRLYPRDFWQRK